MGAGGGGPAGAAVPASQQEPPVPGASLRVYVLTAEPGDYVWERFGHNILRIVDPEAGTDIAWNWGLFDFSQEGFVPRLARGTMLYAMGGFATPAALAEYEATDRRVWAQELDLTPEEKRAVQRTVHENYRPENRFYRYDYYRDNCSTRIRDILDAALGGALRDATTSSDGSTYRWHTRRLLGPVPWAYAGIQLVLGNRADEPITEWEEMFIPMKLREHLGRLTVDRDGGPRPLVRDEMLLMESSRGPVAVAPPDRLGWALAAGLAGAGLMLLLARAAASGSLLPRLGVVVVAGGWSLVAGLAGLLLGLAWAFTDHVFWRWNENLLQVDALALGVAAGFLALVVRPSVPRWVSTLATLVAALSVAGLAIQLLPGFDQVNGEVLALTVPLNVAAALVARRVSGGEGGGLAGTQVEGLPRG